MGGNNNHPRYDKNKYMRVALSRRYHTLKYKNPFNGSCLSFNNIGNKYVDSEVYAKNDYVNCQNNL